MIVSILNFIFNVILFILNIAWWLILIYVIMSLFIPQNKYTQLIGKYIEPVLAPLRKFLYRIFPKLRELGIDFSPLLLYALIWAVSALINLIRNILLF